MNKKRYFILFNPVAGNGKFNDKIQVVKEEFSRRGIDYDLFPTNTDTRADHIVQHQFNPSLYTDVLILGGDGTINETVNGLKHREVPISVISLGTGNDTIKHIQKNLDFNYQLKTAFEGEYTKIDAGICNGRIFLNGVGIGFDGKVVELMSRKGKKNTGHKAYLHAVIRILLTYREKQVSAHFNNLSIHESILLMTIAKGTTFGGGFLINPYAQNNDGLLDICIFKKTPLWMRVVYLPRMKYGGHKDLKIVSFYKSNHVFIEKHDSLVAHMDGEFIGHPSFDISVLPEAFTFRV